MLRYKGERTTLILMRKYSFQGSDITSFSQSVKDELLLVVRLFDVANPEEEPALFILPSLS